MSAKDNFAQAMKELLNGEETPNREPEDKKPAPSSFSSFSQPDARPARAPAPEKKEEMVEKEIVLEEKPSFGFSAPALEKEEDVLASFGTSPSPAPAPAFSTPLELANEEVAKKTVEEVDTVNTSSYLSQPTESTSDERTVIAQGTTIIGDIVTLGSLKVDGAIKGNVQVASMFELNGKIIGDVEAEDAVINNSNVKGNVSARNTINIDSASTIIGDVSAINAAINGKIKGNLTVEERGHFESSAILVGNLVSGSVIIDEGAMLKGDIAITNAQTEEIVVEEPIFDIDIDI